MVNKVYNKKGKVHPAPPPSSALASADDHLSLVLPATILALAASLPLHEKEVLAYFLSCSASSPGVDLVSARPPAKELRGRADHEPRFECACFRCYLSFWSRWDSSPNRRVIDEIIEAFEEHERRAAAEQRRAKQGRRGRKEWNKRGVAEEDAAPAKGGAAGAGGAIPAEPGEADGSGEEEEEAGGEGERGLVRRIGTTIGFKIWNFLDRITM